MMMIYQLFLSNTNLSTSIWFQLLQSYYNNLHTVIYFHEFHFTNNNLYTNIYLK